jgi:hypothetical protein
MEVIPIRKKHRGDEESAETRDKKIDNNEDNKWTRRNLVALWDGQPYQSAAERIQNMAECDRIMIALHRFQTDGKVSYRRLLGMHGGGGGTNDNDFRKLLTDKVNKDIESHSGYSEAYPENGYWPSPVPNTAPTVKISPEDPDRCFSYQFCWHAEPEFLLWHRPIMAEFERGLQEHDPIYDKPKQDGNPKDDKNDRHKGPNALAAPYWAWEGWDGTSLPSIVANPIYVLKTDRWKEQGYPKGSIFANPYHRWFAPVSIADQKRQHFPTTLADDNTTTRASAFTDSGTAFSYPWEQVSIPNKPSMKDVVQFAIQNSNWLEFCTMKPHVGGSNWSIENAHNKFHNHVGGKTKGGIQGPGTPTIDTGEKDESGKSEPAEYTGTMSQNQSIFDPIFWLHHSNVERQLSTWQRRYITDPKPEPESVPSDELMNRVLYPWTKPELLYQGKLSWNTKSSCENDGTFQDWWDFRNLPYKYDEYLCSPKIPYYGNIPFSPRSAFADAIRMTVYIEKRYYKGGEFQLFYTSKSDGKPSLVGSISVLSGQGTPCANCAKRKDGAIDFEVSNTFKTIVDAENAFKSRELSLTRNDKEIKIQRIEVEPWIKKLLD